MHQNAAEISKDNARRDLCAGMVGLRNFYHGPLAPVTDPAIRQNVFIESVLRLVNSYTEAIAIVDANVAAESAHVAADVRRAALADALAELEEPSEPEISDEEARLNAAAERAEWSRMVL